jgi:hypothetical protein
MTTMTNTMKVLPILFLTWASGCAEEPALVLTEAKASKVEGSYRAGSEVIEFTASLEPSGARELHIRSGDRALVDVVTNGANDATILIDGVSVIAALTGDQAALSQLTEFSHSPQAAAITEMAYAAAPELRERMAGDWPATFERLPAVIHLELDSADATFSEEVEGPQCNCAYCLWTDGVKWYGFFCRTEY